MDAIRVENLSKSYENFRLENISFTLPKGCIMGLIGENGAGKSTTIKALLGLIHPDSGTAELGGISIDSDARALHEDVGVVYDECGFHELLNAREVGKVLCAVYQNWDSALYSQLLFRFHIPPKQTVKTLSSGMKMKLGIATALAHHPKLLILDEATSGLDPIVREEILDLFLEFIQDEEHSILLSSHITSDLDKVADYITFLHEGKVQLTCPRDQLQEMGILHCTPEQLRQLPQSDILRIRRNAFGCDALIRRSLMLRTREELPTDPVTLEDLMLFFIRGELPS